MIKILLIDDHELVRSAFEALLNATDNIRVIDSSDCGEAATELIEKNHPDILLMDINMPGIGGVEACRRAIQHFPEIKIIALSVYSDGPIPQQLLKLGVKGFVSKGSSVDELLHTINAVMSGKCYLCTEVANNLVLQGLEGQPEKSPFARLSQREYEVVNLILQGKSIQEMSNMLILSDKTINTYRYRLYNKLKIKNDVELTRLAVKFNHLEGM